MTSAIFQSDGKVEVPSEQLIISVIGPSITCRASLDTLALVLSGPGALFNGKDKMTRLTSSMLTGVNLKQSSEDDTRSGMDEFEQMILFSNASFATASAVRLPTDEKYELNSFNKECVTDVFKVPNLACFKLPHPRHTRTCYFKCSMTK